MTTITQLVFDFFRLCKQEPVQIRQGVWQVQVDDALMKELDGWRAQGRLLQFTFDRKLAETYGADLICPGSYRLNTILQVIRKQGLLSQAHVPHHVFHEPSIRKKIIHDLGTRQRAYVVNNALHYSQYFLFHIVVTQLGREKKESIHNPIVNLSTGEVLKFAIPPHLLQGGSVQGASIRKRKCSFKRAYANAVAQISAELAQADHTWAERANDKLALEEEQLAKFFEGKTTSPEYKAKLQELQKRFAPKIQMDALRGAILYIPVFYYRLIVVDTNGKEKSQNLYYDPVSNLEELE